MGRPQAWAARAAQRWREGTPLKASRRPAIVSANLVRGGPTLRAVHDEPVHAASSGWAFHGDEVIAEVEGAQVWALGNVLRREPSLVPHLTLPPGTVLERAGEGWRKLRFCPDQP